MNAMNTTTKLVRIAPRVLCIIALLFISIFALDAFDSRMPLSQQIDNFLIHLIPTFILAIFLLVAWKWELIGGLIFVLIGAAFSPIVYHINHSRNHFPATTSLGIVLLVTFPFILVGGLFLLSHFLKKQQSGSSNNRELMTGSDSRSQPAIAP